MHSNAIRYLKLTDAFLAGFNWNQDKLTRDGFRNWARAKRQPAIRVNPHKWPVLKDGGAVPEEMVLAFSEYISDVLKLGRFPVGSIAARSEPEAKPKERQAIAGRNAWRMGWADLFSFIARCRTVPEEAYCQNDADVALAASMVLQCVGAREDRTASGDAAVAVAERIMKRKLDDYAQLLLTFWKSNEHSVLFATRREKQATARVGVSVVVPLTREAYQRFRSGGAEDSDITAADIVDIGHHMIVGAAADNREMDVRRSKADRSMSQVITFLYQLACFCPPLADGGEFPSLIAFAGTQESRHRLEAYSFRDIGTKTPLTGMAVMELARGKTGGAGTSDPRSLAQHLAVRATIQVYQATIKAAQQLAE